MQRALRSNFGLVVACLSFAVGACATMSEPPPIEVVADDAGDAAPWHDPPAGLCCQITDNNTSDPYWQNMRYICDPEAGINNVTVGGNDIPWICDIQDDGSGVTCDSPSCGVGQKCLGFNGRGKVVPCDWDGGS